MHIVMIGDHPLPGEKGNGGVKRAVQVLRQHLSKNGVRLTMLVPGSKISRSVTDEYGDIIYIRQPPLPGVIGYWTVTSFKLLKLVKRLKPDIIHLQAAHGYIFLWPNSIKKTPMVFTMHGIPGSRQGDNVGFNLRNMTSFIRYNLFNIIEKVTRKYVDEIIAITPYIFDVFPFLKNKSHHFIDNPVDDVFFRKIRKRSTGNKSEQYNLLQVGHINRNKNMIHSIRLLDELIKTGLDVKLHIIGDAVDPAYFQICKDLVSRLGLEEKVVFHGILTPQAISDQMDMADALLITSLQETAPMVVAEAHCRGLPVISPRKFGMKYMIEEGLNGVFLDASSDTENAKKTASLLKTPPDRSALIENARKAYNPATIAMLTRKVYEKASLHQTVNS